MFEKEAEKYRKEKLKEQKDKFVFELPEVYIADIKQAYQDGAEFGYKKGQSDQLVHKQYQLNQLRKANEWHCARTKAPVPKNLGIYQYSTEVISDKGELVCYDYKEQSWKKLVIENEKVTYVPVEIEMWCNKPTRENE